MDFTQSILCKMQAITTQAGIVEIPAEYRDELYDYLDWCDYLNKYNRPLDEVSAAQKAFFELIGVDANPDNWTKVRYPDAVYRKYEYYFQHQNGLIVT